MMTTSVSSFVLCAIAVASSSSFSLFLFLFLYQVATG
jgi:hypothetical protein